MSPSSPPFSVSDFIWEEIKIIANAPQKSCGYAPYLMAMIETVTQKTFDYDHVHKSFQMKTDLEDPTLAAQLGRDAPAGPNASETAPNAEIPPVGASMAARTNSRRKGASTQHETYKPPSPIRKMFNFLCCMQMDNSERLRKIEQRQKKETQWRREWQASNTPNVTLSPAESEGEDRALETPVQTFQRAQQTDYYSQFFPPQMPNVHPFGGSTSADPYAPSCDPYAPGSSSGQLAGSEFASMIFGGPTPYPPPFSSNPLAHQVPQYPPPARNDGDNE